jgi:hypothetical protein
VPVARSQGRATCGGAREHVTRDGGPVRLFPARRDVLPGAVLKRAATRGTRARRLLSDRARQGARPGARRR